MSNLTTVMDASSKITNCILCEILDSVVNISNRRFNKGNIVVTCTLSSSETTFICGKYAIFENLPLPHVEITDGHVCTRIDEVIAHHLAFGRNFSFTVESNKSNNRTPHQKIPTCMDAQQWTTYCRRWDSHIWMSLLSISLTLLHGLTAS